MKPILFCLLPIGLFGADGSANQIILTYTCATTSTVVISRQATYTGGILNTPVDDVNESIFPGSSQGNRPGSGVAPNNQNLHYFVAGTREADLAADGVTWVSRSLLNNTLHYWQVICGATILPNPNQSFQDHTGNLATDDTRGEAPDPRLPTIADVANVDYIDPKSGSMFRNLWTTSDYPPGNTPTLYSGARKHMCSKTMTGPGPGWMCSFESDNGGGAQLFYIIPTTREIRFLGIQRGSATFPSCDALANVTTEPDDDDPTLTFVNGRYHVSGPCNDSGVFAAVIVRQAYLGNFAAVAPGSNANVVYTLMNTAPTFIPNQVQSFNAAFDPALFPNCAFEEQGKYGYLECRAGIQGSIAWEAIYDMGDRQPLGSCGNCFHIIAATPEWTENSVGTPNPNHRWLGSHSGSLVGGGTLAFIVPGGFEGCTNSPTSTTLTSSITTLNPTTLTVASNAKITAGQLISVIFEGANTTEWFLVNSVSGTTIHVTGAQLGSAHSLHNVGAQVNVFFCDPTLYPQYYLGPFASQITQNITNATTSFTVNGQPLSLSDATLAPFLMNIEIGDQVHICWGSTLTAPITSVNQTAITVADGSAVANGSRLMIGLNPTETVVVSSGGGTNNLVVARGQMGSTAWTYSAGAQIQRYYDDCGATPFRTITNVVGNTWSIDSAFPAGWPAGSSLITNGGRFPEGRDHYWWWDFLVSPNGEPSGFVPENNPDFYGNHGDWMPNLYVTEAFHVRAGPLALEISQPATLEITATPVYNGVTPQGGGNSYGYYPVVDKLDASLANQNWFLDFPGLIGGGSFSATPGAVLAAGASQVYKYRFCTVPNGCTTHPLVLHRRQIPTFAQSGPNVLVDVSGPGVIMTDGPAGNGTYCVPEVAGECWAGSVVGDAYANVTGLNNFICQNDEEARPGLIDLCIADTNVTGATVFQFSLIPSATGYGRKLSAGMSLTGLRPAKELAKSTPDGNLIFWRSQASRMFMLTPPPFQQTKDSFDRTQYIPINTTLPPAGLLLPVGTATAEIDFGYAEDNGNCTTRHEPCATVTAGSIPVNEFVFTTVDAPYTRLPCSSGCTPTIPAVAGRTLYSTACYYDGSGIQLRCDVLPPQIVAPAAFTPTGTSGLGGTIISGQAGVSSQVVVQ